jgi:hypothetical protein
MLTIKIAVYTVDFWHDPEPVPSTQHISIRETGRPSQIRSGKAPRILNTGTRRRCVISFMLRPLQPWRMLGQCGDSGECVPVEKRTRIVHPTVNHSILIALDGLVVTWLPLDLRFGSSNPAEGNGFLRAIKIHSTTFLGGEVNPSAQCRKISRHVKEPYVYERDTS